MPESRESTLRGFQEGSDAGDLTCSCSCLGGGSGEDALCLVQCFPHRELELVCLRFFRTSYIPYQNAPVYDFSLHICKVFKEGKILIPLCTQVQFHFAIGLT